MDSTEPLAREYPPVLLPHADFGDPECCGLIMPAIRGELADLTCNECGFVLRTVPAAEGWPTLARMAETETVTSHTCPHCGMVNAFPGWSVMMAYVCRHCGQGVAVEESRA